MAKTLLFPTVRIFTTADGTKLCNDGDEDAGLLLGVPGRGLALEKLQEFENYEDFVAEYPDALSETQIVPAAPTEEGGANVTLSPAPAGEDDEKVQGDQPGDKGQSSRAKAKAKAKAAAAAKAK